jgi:ribonuclease III
MPSTTSSPSWADALDEELRSTLAERLGYSFSEPDALTLALRHRSWCAEHPGHQSNERLEFLGDAVVGLAVAEHLYAEFPTMPEAEMSKVRASVVSATALAEVAAGLGLGAGLLLGKGEDASGGRAKPSILADALEAVIGAIYRDGGWTAARAVVLELLSDRIYAAAEGPGGQDYKSQLQELAARRFDHLPVYELRGEGPDHQKRFFARVRLGGEVQGDGEGRSKKQAEQRAAEAAWHRLTAQLADHREAEPAEQRAGGG